MRSNTNIANNFDSYYDSAENCYHENEAVAMDFRDIYVEAFNVCSF